MKTTDAMDSVGPTWDRRYLEHGWSVVPDESLIELVAPLTPGRALDLGCGTGRNALFLASAGWSVTGVDASRVGLDTALAHAALRGVSLEVVHADLLDYVPVPAYFELVVVANIHFLAPERDAFFARAAAAVVPGGHLFVVGHHVDAFGKAGPPVRERLFEESLFENRFTGLRLERLERRESNSDAGDTDDVSVVVWATRESAEVAQ